MVDCRVDDEFRRELFEIVETSALRRRRKEVSDLVDKIPCLLGMLWTIQDVADPDLPVAEDTVLDENKADEKKKIDARKRNLTAMANLTMALTSEGAMSLVFESYSDEWPSGLAWKVVKALKLKYMPQDTMT